MNYEDFLNAVVEKVKEYAGEEAEVLIHSVTKNNGVLLDGLIILEKGQNISPTVYLNSFYERYVEGMEIAEVARDVYSIYLNNIGNVKLSVEDFKDFDKIKDKIAYRLVNFDKNKEFLKKIPFRRWMDLAITYYVIVEEGPERAVATIHNSHMELWKTDENALYELASANTPRLEQAEIKPMNEVIEEIMDRVSEDKHEYSTESLDCMNEMFPLYVLTNRQRNQGAICMLYDSLMENFASKINADIYVLPSSIHEVILVPKSDDITVESLIDMVRTVNSSEVSQEELLSNSVYCYTRGKGF